MSHEYGFIIGNVELPPDEFLRSIRTLLQYSIRSLYPKRIVRVIGTEWTKQKLLAGIKLSDPSAKTITGTINEFCGIPIVFYQTSDGARFDAYLEHARGNNIIMLPLEQPRVKNERM